MRYLVLFLALLSFSPASFASYAYPETAKRSFVNDCMKQPLPQRFGQIDQRTRFAQCTCMFFFAQENIPYQDFMKIDQLARSGQIRAIPVRYLKLIEQGTTACARRFIMNQR